MMAKFRWDLLYRVKNDERGEEAARQLAKKMGFEDVNIAYKGSLDAEFTYYVVYGSTIYSIDYTDIHVQTVEERQWAWRK